MGIKLNERRKATKMFKDAVTPNSTKLALEVMMNVPKPKAVVALVMKVTTPIFLMTLWSASLTSWVSRYSA